MDKIYGYREKDIIGLAQFLKDRSGNSLSKIFEQYGAENSKAKGTVRNLYYAVAKRSVTDQEFCQKYLDGKPLSVGKIIEFAPDEEKELIKKVILAKADGKSARSAIMEISGGDAKIALRYQNKYRNALKNKQHLINEVVEELNSSGQQVSNPLRRTEFDYVSEENFVKLKSEINNLIARIAIKEKRENEFLKEKIILLEKENLRLSNALYGKRDLSASVNFFRRGGEQNILN